MKATTVLKEEHGLILELLDQLAVAGEKIVRNERPPRQFFEEAMAFARQFADKFRHFKEEDVMFRILAQKKGGSMEAYLERSKQEQGRCRNCVVEISNSLDGYEAGDDSEIRKLHRNLTDYVMTLRHHINFENASFFPKVGRGLSPEEPDGLAEELQRRDEKMGGSVFEDNEKRLRAMAAMLQDK